MLRSSSRVVRVLLGGWRRGRVGLLCLLVLGRDHGLRRMALHLTSTTARSTEVQLLYMHRILVQISYILAKATPCHIRLIATTNLNIIARRICRCRSLHHICVLVLTCRSGTLGFVSCALEAPNYLVVVDCEALRGAIGDAFDVRLLRRVILSRSVHGRACTVHAVEAGGERVFLPLLAVQLDIVLLIAHLLGHHFRLSDLLMSCLTLRLL